jgi:hypothetical protein
MCHRTTCPVCGAATWRGCGQHIESALSGVPPAERCSCPRDQVEAAWKQGERVQITPLLSDKARKVFRRSAACMRSQNKLGHACD